MLTDLRWRVCLGPRPKTISPKTVQPLSPAPAPAAPASEFKRFRACSPAPQPGHARRQAPRTLADEPFVTASHDNLLLVRAITCFAASDKEEEEAGEGGVNGGDLVYEYGQEIKVAIVTKSWCWGSYVDGQGVEHSGIVPRYCVERVPVTCMATAAPEEEEEDYLKELESCLDDGFRL